MALPLSGLVGLVAILSLDVTRGLVAAGYGLGYDTDTATAAGAAGRFTATPSPTTGLLYPPLAITGATNTTPIVITTAYPHGVSSRGIGGLSCILSGITGNFAANNIDTDPRSRTVGLPAGVLAVPTGPTTLALYGQDPLYGNLVPIASSGAYTGGGVLVPALTDGSILLGRENTREHSAAPRIVLVPRGIKSEGKRGSIPTGARLRDRRAQIQQRSIGTDVFTIDVHAWGQATPPDPAVDFTITHALREAVRVSLHLLSCGASSTGDGLWDDEKERATQHIKAGHLLTFAITLQVPVVDDPILGGFPFIPDATTVETTVQSPTPEIAAVFETSITPA